MKDMLIAILNEFNKRTKDCGYYASSDEVYFAKDGIITSLCEIDKIKTINVYEDGIIIKGEFNEEEDSTGSIIGKWHLTKTYPEF